MRLRHARPLPAEKPTPSDPAQLRHMVLHLEIRLERQANDAQDWWLPANRLAPQAPPAAHEISDDDDDEKAGRNTSAGSPP
jgi:hypothetical protein